MLHDQLLVFSHAVTKAFTQAAAAAGLAAGSEAAVASPIAVQTMPAAEENVHDAASSGLWDRREDDEKSTPISAATDFYDSVTNFMDYMSDDAAHSVGQAACKSLRYRLP